MTSPLTILLWLCWLSSVALYVFGVRGIRALVALALALVLIAIAPRLGDRAEQLAYEWWLILREWGELDRCGRRR